MHFLFKRYEKDEMTFLVEKNDIFRAGLQEQRMFEMKQQKKREKHKGH